MEQGPFDIFSLSVLLILLVAMPLEGVWDFRRLLRWTRQGLPDARLRSYNRILILEWGLTIGLVSWWLMTGRGWGSLGLAAPDFGWRWLALGLGLAAAGFQIRQMSSVLKSPEQLEELRAKIGSLSALVPVTAQESRMFSLVSITAGACEEILYRGILMSVLIPVVGLWPAVGLSSVIFGMGHAYQGFSGILKTTGVGLVMALLTVFSGSLLVAMVLHAVIDLTSGRMMGAALRGEKQGHAEVCSQPI